MLGCIYYKVDVPFRIVEIRRDIDIGQFTKKRPNWKGHRKCGNQLYQSKKALGELWDLVKKEIGNVGKSFSDQETRAEVRISKFVVDEQGSFDEVKVGAVRTRMRQLIENYMDNRARQKQLEIPDDQFYRWIDAEVAKGIEVFKAEKSDLMRKLSAAILYEQAIEVGKNNNAALRFVWDVAVDYLCCLIVPGSRCLVVANENIPALR
jgi:hypothetical protein